MIELKHFDPKLLKIDRKWYKYNDIYYMGKILKICENCENIYSVNPLYLLIDHANGYIKEKGVNKDSVFDSVDENKELLKKYGDVWDRIKNKIKEVSDSEYYYEKD